jgi:predicted aldo/keto reductase-like oxidoreductase
MAGVGAALIGCSNPQEPEEAPKTVNPTQEPEETLKTTTPREVPKRTFGKTGEQVSILSLGGIFDTRPNQLLLNQAVKMGVTYWDTSESYINGASEEGMGQYFERNPEDRKKVFLVSKSKARGPEGHTKSLTGSLERLKTSYVDLYFLHGIDDVEKNLTPEVKQWAEKAKSDGKIKYFGFSTHNNVEDCLEGAAKLGWIDGIMMTYNYRTMQTDRVKAAVDACTKAGIGLTAMKTQAKVPTGGPPRRPRRDMESMSHEEREAMQARLAEMRREIENAPPDELTLQLTERFRNKGFTLEQAKLNLVWESPQIASICSAMYNMTVLMQNVAAATGNVRLTQKDKDLLTLHAAQTTYQYCPGCTHHCQSGSEEDLPIGLVMRCLMYARDYGDRDLGKTTFQSLSAEMRRAISRINYTEAERRCPNSLPIGELMREAAIELA